MKIIFLFSFIAVMLMNCSPMKVKNSQGKLIAEDFFQKIDKGDYEGAFTHYLEQGTSKEEKIEQYNKLKEVFGEITSFQLVDSLSGTPETEETLVLQYKIQHSKLVSIEKFILIMDDGEPKIMFHNVENEK